MIWPFKRKEVIGDCTLCPWDNLDATPTFRKFDATKIGLPANINLNAIDWNFFAEMMGSRRKFLGLSQADVAFILDLPIEEIAKAEARQKTSLKTYVVVCHWFHVRFEWFYQAKILDKWNFE